MHRLPPQSHKNLLFEEISNFNTDILVLIRRGLCISVSWCRWCTAVRVESFSPRGNPFTNSGTTQLPRVHLLQTAKEVKLMFLFSGSLAWPQALFPILLSPRLSPCTLVAPLSRHRCQGVDWTALQNAFTTKKQLPPPLGIGTMQTDTETPLKAHLRFGTRSGPRDVLFYILPRVLYLPLQSML